MKLLQLTSDNTDFKTLNFNPNLNIVAGLQLSEKDKDTINGIGKSSTLTLLHLMFGSKLDSKKPKEAKLKKFLKTYGTFYLTFTHKGKEYEIKKDFSQTDYYINDEKITQTDYPSKLSEIFLEKGHDLKFKQIFNCFARRFGGDYYSDPLRQQGQPLNDYYQRFVNLKLLNIEMDLVKEKFSVEDKIAKLDKAKSIIEEYQEALDTTNLKDLKDEFESLKKDKSNFIIAKNYDHMKIESDELTKELNQLRDKIQKIKNLLQKKEQNLLVSENINIDASEIENLYNEAFFFFDSKITKRLEDAQKFHNTLISNRKKRIEIEIKELTIELNDLNIEVEKIANKRDASLEILNNSGALEEYNSIEERIKFLNSEIQKLTKYEETLNDFKKDKSALNVESAKIKEKSILYLTKEKEFLGSIEDKFREIVKRFYDNHGGSLELKETKSAKYLYDIAVEIPRGSSQAIGEVEIFCYDVLLYKLNQGILNFMAHDGYIFSEMDPRQKATIFKVILELIENNDLQYFINIGENSLNEVLEQKVLSDKEKEQISKSIILELYDKNPKNWFFGQEFN
ncbi:MAG: DUF2326 domain-containing protein [Candidatus Muirbacterium halophilum]|nr:DUF2326 domain-containing protein [Candidatus Muirbacterium halophilum]